MCMIVGECEVLTSGGCVDDKAVPRMCPVVLMETSIGDHEAVCLSTTIDRGAFQLCGPN